MENEEQGRNIEKKGTTEFSLMRESYLSTWK